MEFTLPKDKGGAYKKCKMYPPANVNDLNLASSPLVAQLKSLDNSVYCQEDNFNKSYEVDCSDGYVYDRSIFETSATMEVCSILFTVIQYISRGL